MDSVYICKLCKYSLTLLTKNYPAMIKQSIFTLVLLCFTAATALAQTYTAEPVDGMEAVYNEADNTVTVTGTAPTMTEFDWNIYEQYPLPYISYVRVDRHEPNTDWPDEEYARVEGVVPGGDIVYVDSNVEPDKKYEYRLTVYVDETPGSPTWDTVYTGVMPDAVTNFTASTADHLTTTVDLSVTAPTLTDAGRPLTQPVTIEIQQEVDYSYVTLHIIDAAEPGQTYTWQHEGLEPGHSYYYRAVAKTGTQGVSLGVNASVYVGLDSPGTPENFTCTPQGANVLLTWEQPLKGYRNGSYDPENTTYTLTRVYFDDTEELVKAGIKGTTYTDNLGSAEEMAVRYKLVAVNAAGESMTAAECGPVNAGSPAALPFKESFAECVYAHKGWSTATTQDPDGYVYEAWELKHTGTMYHFPTDEDLSINPQDGDGGFAACLFYGYCEEGQTESLISPNMAVEGVKAVDLKFWLYEVEDDASGNILNVSVSYDGGEWQQVYTHEPPADGAPQWREITVPVTVKEGCGKLRLKFDAVRMGLMYTDVLIDNITVEKSTSSAIEGVVTDGADAQAPAEYFTLSGVRVSKPVAPGTYIVRRGDDVKKIMVK